MQRVPYEGVSRMQTSLKRCVSPPRARPDTGLAMGLIDALVFVSLCVAVVTATVSCAG